MAEKKKTCWNCCFSRIRLRGKNPALFCTDYVIWKWVHVSWFIQRCWSKRVKDTPN